MHRFALGSGCLDRKRSPGTVVACVLCAMTFLASVAGCSGGGGASAADAGGPTPPLSSCILGIWSSPDSPCSTSMGTPESSKPDCQSASFLDYTSGGILYSGVYTYSPAVGTMSGTYVVQNYTLTEGGLGVQPGTHVFQVTCSSSRLVEDSQTTTRAPSRIAAAIQTVVGGDGGSFVSVPVQ